MSRTIDALATNAPAALRAINNACATARAHGRRWPAPTPPTRQIDARNPLIIDLDATLVASHSEKVGAAANF